MSGFVYLWTNKINGKKYLGSHVGSPDDGYVGSGKLFKRAVAKYGIASFERVIVEDGVENTIEREQYYLDLMNCAADPRFYNLHPQAGGGFQHYNTSETLEMRRKRLPKVNHLSSRFAGKTHSDESKRKTRSSVIATFKAKGLCRRVQQLTKTGEYMTTFDSINEAARAVGTAPSNIQGACEGRLKVIKGHRWTYD